MLSNLFIWLFIIIVVLVKGETCVLCTILAVSYNDDSCTVQPLFVDTFVLWTPLFIPTVIVYIENEHMKSGHLPIIQQYHYVEEIQ